MVRDTSWPYAHGIKQQIILYVTERLNIEKNAVCTQEPSIKTVSCRDMMLFLTHYWLQDVNAIFEVCTLAWMKLPFL